MISNEKMKMSNFEEKIGCYDGMKLRFPPEPNGFLHLGHAKAIVTNFELAKKYNGTCYLRLDDTNPDVETEDFVSNIIKDIEWFGYKPDKITRASENLLILTEYAEKLIRKNLAYVDFSTSEEIAKEKGDLSNAGKNSKYREIYVEKNLNEFNKMVAGEYVSGTCVVRAKIDMAHPNLLMRDPVIFRIKAIDGKNVAVPTYDFAHGQCDSIEEITHSLCTLEFLSHKELYNWIQENLDIPKSTQHEFSRLNIEYNTLSKRKIKQLVEHNIVDGWDDPRLLTLAALKRKGYTANSIIEFIRKVGLSNKDNTIVSQDLLEASLRDELLKTAPVYFAVIEPIKVIFTNFRENEEIVLNNRKLILTKEIFVEKTDFMEMPTKDFYRLYVGNKVRLKGAYIVDVKDYRNGIIYAEIQYDEKSGDSKTKVKSTIHWLSEESSKCEKIVKYHKLFENKIVDDILLEACPNSRVEYLNSLIELNTTEDGPVQFFRNGFYVWDNKDNCFIETVPLKSSYSYKKEMGNS